MQFLGLFGIWPNDTVLYGRFMSLEVAAHTVVNSPRMGRNADVWIVDEKTGMTWSKGECRAILRNRETM